MILMYHNISEKALTKWHVSIATFERQMEYLKNYDVVYLADYDPSNPRQAVITFDDGYSNVVKYALPILERWNYPFEIFVIGNHIGKSNYFDSGLEPESQCADMDELRMAASSLARLQWHSRSHPRLAAVPLELANIELDVPDYLTELFPKPHFRWFAYPYGSHSEKTVNEARLRFDGAVSVNLGNDSDIYQLNRVTVIEGSKLFLPLHEKDFWFAKMERELIINAAQAVTLKTILSSRSWRYTALLRKLGEFGGKVKTALTSHSSELQNRHY